MYNDADKGVHGFLVNEHGKKYCKTCFKHVSEFITNPLNTKTLDVTSEWVREIPLEIQQLLSMIFINKDSVRRVDQLLSFLRTKLVRLYFLFHVDLNSYNRKYSGITQQLNTEELIVNYHSLSTVFQITS